MEGIQPKVTAEYDTAKTIIVHRPSLEMLIGSAFFSAALYEGPMDRRMAAKEHDAYVQELEKQGAEVLHLRDILLNGTRDTTGNIIEGPVTDELRQMALYSMHLLTDGIQTMCDRAKIGQQKKFSVEFMAPEDLVEIILLQPTYNLSYSDENNSEYAASVQIKPVYNQTFFRDQQITTDKGVVIGSMNSKERTDEVAITELAFKKLGIQPIYKVNCSGRLEGGDFIPAGEIAFIGTGHRTNPDAIAQLFDNDCFGYSKVGVVKDEWKSQTEMHLDTYFNIPAKGKAIVLENRVGQAKNGDNREPSVDVYERQPSGKYTLMKEYNRFSDCLRDEGFEIIPVSKDLQMSYGINFLTVGDGKIIGVDIAKKEVFYKNIHKLGEKLGALPGLEQRNYAEISTEYNTVLKKAGVEETLLPFNHLNMAYGGPHCLTQVILRL